MKRKNIHNKHIKNVEISEKMKKKQIICFFVFLAVFITALLFMIFNDGSTNADNSNSNMVSTLKTNTNALNKNSVDIIKPRHIFYHSPRVFSDPSYASSCYPTGELMDALPGNKCCDGLESLSIIDEAENGCKFLVGASICSDCGNEKCEYGENKCNCPEDCKKQ